MNREKLIQAITDQHSLPKKEAQSIVQLTVDHLTNELHNHNEVSIPKFGKFQVKERKAKTIPGPIANGKVLPKHNAVTFVSYKGLKEAVNHG